METLKVTFTKRKDDNTIYKPAYFSSKAQIVINPNDFIPSLQSPQQQLLNGVAVWCLMVVDGLLTALMNTILVLSYI